MRFFIVASLALSFHAQAAPLTAIQKQQFRLHGELTAYTLKEKKLPAKFVKVQTAKPRSAEDAAIFNKAIKTWTKNFDKGIGYSYYGSAMAITYKDHPVIKFEITETKPLTVKINGAETVNLDTKSPLQALMGAVKKAGYTFSGKNRSAWIIALPEANAAEADGIAGGIENSIILASNSGYLTRDANGKQWLNGEVTTGGMALGETKRLAAEGYLFPAWWNGGLLSVAGFFANFNQTNVTCSANSVKGTVTDGNGKEIAFSADRKKGVEFSFEGHIIQGTPEPVGVSQCKRLQELQERLVRLKGIANPSEDERYSMYVTEDGINTRRRDLFDYCRSVQQILPSGKLDCSEISDGLNLPKAEETAAINKVCDATKNLMLSSPSQYSICEGTACTEKTLVTADGNMAVKSLPDFLKFRKKYEKLIKEGAISSGPYPKVTDPSRFTGEESKAILKDVYAMLDARSIAPDFVDMGTATMGLLDCCGDTECKGALMEKKINLIPEQPAESTH